MGKRRIFTVGLDLPGEEFESVEFESDQTLLDADIVLFQPTLGSCNFEYNLEWAGKSVLTHRSSFSRKSRVDHWRTEIAAAVNAGKLVVVYLVKPVEHCRFTGQTQHSGTGRSRVTTNVVADISSYDAVPNLTKVTPKSGSSITLTKDGAFLSSYWKDFAAISTYEVEIDGAFNKVVLRAKAGDRIVGSAVHGKSGAMLFLPPLQYDEERFIKETAAGEMVWTSEALKFGKRLVTALYGVADVLKRQGNQTPPPDWSLGQEFRLAVESDVEERISKCTQEITKLQERRVALSAKLQDAGLLRSLLFEQGKPLEHSILEAMRMLGFDAKAVVERDLEFDGVFVSPEGRCLGEAEGRDSKAINIDKFSQLERNINEDFARDGISKHAKGLLFGNASRLKPLNERGEFFTDKCISAARRIGAALIRTPDLFAPAKYLSENPNDLDYAKRCRLAIFDAAGAVVSFPEPPATGETKIGQGATAV